MLLYELLVGARPLDLSGKSPIELQRTILEQEPVAPSKRLGGDDDAEAANVAGKRGTSVGALRRRILRELESITLCALSKDRRWRYQTALAFAEDVERHMRGETVRVSSPSSAYRLRRFVRRHTVAAAFTGVLVLVAFAGAVAVLAKRIAIERDAARQAQSDLESVVAFQAGMLSEMDTEGVGRRMVADLRERVAELRRGRGDSESEVEEAVESFEAALEGLNATAAVRLIDEEILERALETLEDRFAEQPLIDARLRGTIGVTYRRLGRYERAEPQL